jgi:hypothetical protein
MNIALALFTLFAYAPVPTQNYYCEIEETSTSNGRQTVTQRKIWVKGQNRFRMEKSGTGYSLIHILKDADAWLLDSASRKGYHARKSSNRYDLFAQAESWRRDLTLGPEEWIRTGAKKIGQKILNGTVCDLYRRKEKDGTIYTVWIQRTPPRLPLRLEASGSLPMPGKQHVTFTSRFQFKGWQKRKTMEDALFLPPPAYQIKQAIAQKTK